MNFYDFSRCHNDHCRIGSLEMTIAAGLVYYYDHCRIGSLEIQQPT